jgi:hypothetical protein
MPEEIRWICHIGLYHYHQNLMPKDLCKQTEITNARPSSALHMKSIIILNTKQKYLKKNVPNWRTL